MVDVSIGTFNLNNLFTRWNFQASVPKGTVLTEKLEFTDASTVRLRTFIGRVVTAKSNKSTAEIAARILTMDLDVLAVQEVENIEALRTFNQEHLDNLYPHVVLIEGNDPRLIDVGLLSKLPLRRIVSHQTEPDPVTPSKRVFGRDLLQVDVYNPAGTKRLFTVFNTHMKSNFVDTRKHRTPAAQAQAAIDANLRRQRQAQVTAAVIKRETRPNSRFVFLGDMNDDPDSPHMAPVVDDAEIGLVDALINVVQTRPSKHENDGPQPGPRWTSRHRANRKTSHRLFDQIWVSPALQNKIVEPTIDRRTKHGGNGSDHDPAWITLQGLN